MKKIAHKKIIIIIIAIIVVVGGIFWYISYRGVQVAKEAAASIETTKLTKGQLQASISVIGTVRARQTTTLYWETTGSVEKVNVKEGDRVKKGDILANLAQDSLPQSVISAQAELTNAQQALDDLYTSAEQAKIDAMQKIVTYEENVRDAKYQLDNFLVSTSQKKLSAVEAVRLTEERLDKARQAFEPYKLDPLENTTRKRLKEALDIAQSDYDAAVKRLKYEYDYEVAQANLAKAIQDYEKYKDGPTPGELEAAKARIAAAQATIDMRWIKSPFDGIVTYVVPQVGDQVAQSSSLSSAEAFRVDDLSTLYIDVDVTETDIGMVSIGQEANVSLDALRDKEYHGEVDNFDMVGDTSSDVVNFTVTVKLIDADDSVRPGMTAEVDIITDERTNVLLIPNQAIRVENGKTVVYKINAAQVSEPVEVKVGISSDTHTELLEGDLKEGDFIVLNPAAGAAAARMQRMFMGGGEPPPEEQGNNPQGQGGNTP